MKYYLDTCIWIDYYMNRSGPRGRPLGVYATRLFMKIFREKDTILFSDLTYHELRRQMSRKDIEEMLTLISAAGLLKKIRIKDEENTEAKKLSAEKKIHIADALHAVLTKNYSAVLISQDKHFGVVKDIIEVKKPEET